MMSFYCKTYKIYCSCNMINDMSCTSPFPRPIHNNDIVFFLNEILSNTQKIINLDNTALEFITFLFRTTKFNV
jgi:hypothetical protein